MALKSMLVEVPLRGGQNQKANALRLPPNAAVWQAVDCVFDDGGQPKKRGGSASVTYDGDLGAPGFDTCMRLTAAGQSLLVEDKARGLTVLERSGTDAWWRSTTAPVTGYKYRFVRGAVDRTDLTSVLGTSTTNTLNGVRSPDCVSSADYGTTCYAWLELLPAGTIRQIAWKVTNTATGETLKSGFFNPASDTGLTLTAIGAPRLTFTTAYGYTIAVGVTNAATGKTRILGYSIGPEGLIAALAVTFVAEPGATDDIVLATVDVKSAGTRHCLSWGQFDTGAGTGAAYVGTINDLTGVVTSVNSGADLTSATLASFAAGIIVNSGTTSRWCTVYATTNGVNAAATLKVITRDFENGGATTVITTLNGPIGAVVGRVNYGTVTCVQAGSSGSNLLVVYETQRYDLTVNPDSNAALSAVQVTTAGAATGDHALLNGLLIASGIWMDGSKPMLAVARAIGGGASQRGVGSGLFVVDLTNWDGSATGPLNVVARVAPGDYSTFNAPFYAGTVTAPPRVVTASSGRAYSFLGARQVILSIEGADIGTLTYRTLSALSSWKLDLDANLGAGVPLNASTLLPGACPHWFDGHQPAEAGFNSPPEIVTATQTAGGGLTAGGVYSFCFVLEFIDAEGRRHLSQPSAISGPITLGGGVGSVTFTVRYDRLTERWHDPVGFGTGTKLRSMRLLLFRTVASGTDFRLERGEVLSTDSTSSTTVTIVSTTADGTAATSTAAATGMYITEFLYTTGGILPNQPYPACKTACSHQSRIFMAGLEDPFEVAYTHETQLAYAPEYAGLKFRVGTDYGKVIGLASMGDKLIIGCERGSWVVFGQGPNRLGFDNNYSQPQSLLPGTGWRSPHCCVTEEGVWFNSTYGIRLLGQSLTLVSGEAGQEGSAVDSYCGQTYPGLGYLLRGVVRDEQTQRLYFLTGSTTVGPILMFDTLWRSWSAWTANGINIARWAADGTICTVDLNSYVNRFPRLDGLPTTGTNYLDTGASITPYVVSPWVSLETIDGFQRLRRVGVVLRAQMAGAGSASATPTVEYQFDDSADSDSWSSATSLGAILDNVAWGKAVELECCPPVQKCTRVRFRLKSTETSGAGTAGVSFVGLVLDIGVKKGPNQWAVRK